MRRDLFVFAGQSNMMGAAVFSPRQKLSIKSSYEYKHKSRRLGARVGDFVAADYPVGEFSYIDIQKAYAAGIVNEKGESTLEDYVHNTYFCPSMSNLCSKTDKSVYPFSSFSEATARNGVTLAPFLAQEWEQKGQSCAYAHIAKGGVSMAHYMNEEMAEEYTRRITEYNQVHGTDYNTELSSRNTTSGAADYFFKKCKDFFQDAKQKFSNDTLPTKCLFWLQGESDARSSSIEYEIKLDIFWEKLKTLGFTHFFCIRVDYFGLEGIDNIMRAQENFVSKHADAYMLTRVASYFTYIGQNNEERFVVPPLEIHKNCRDSFYGYNNNHINEKGFSVIATSAINNLYRILIEGKEPLLEKENIRTLLNNNS